ncbi:MAG: UDP-2,3-diacylglucosamine diphosphatase [Caldimonas sp.]
MAARPAPATLLPLPEATPTFEAPASWRAIDFLSDLHLAATTPRAFEAWAAHLRQTRADAVFILGDLFELWIGDDIGEQAFESRCVDVLKEAATRRTIAFMPGNRDFLVGDALLEQSGVMRLHDPTVISAFGQRLLVSHGDALCLDDVGYQRFRRVVRHPTSKRAFLALPRPWRDVAGRAVRRRSGREHGTARATVVDVDAAAVLAWLEGANAPTLVHGHTHAPARHELAPGRSRVVLSDWDLDAAEPPRADVLRWQAGGLERIRPEGGATSEGGAST